jgi:hypothetical protein
MLYTSSTSGDNKKMSRMKHYYIMPGHGNDPVAPDNQDLNLLNEGVITAKGFELNYQVKLRSREAYEWMDRVSREAIHEDIVLVGENEGLERKYRVVLAEIMISMFGGKMDIHYGGEL